MSTQSPRFAPRLCKRMEALLLLTVCLMFGVVVATVGLGGVVSLSAHRAARAAARHTQQLAEQRGFRPDGEGAIGEVAGYAARLDPVQEGQWLLQVEGLPTDLALRMSTSGSHTVRSGDRRLDRTWAIGSVEGGVGRLDRPARGALARLRVRAADLVLSGGSLRVRCGPGTTLVDVLATTEALVKALEGDPLERLVETVRTDPDPKVRGQMLWELAQHDRGLAVETVDARDPDSTWGSTELLLMGELLGRPAFLERTFAHPSTNLRLAGRALDSWLALDQDPALGIGWMAQHHGLDGLTLAAERIHEASPSQAPALIPWVMRALVQQDHQKVQRAVVALVRALQRHGVQDAVPELLEALTRATGPARLRIVDAVGALGTVDAVPALRTLQGSLGVADFQTSAAVDRAVALIQGRASGHAGALSLADEPEGAGMLSIAAAQGGDLAALPDEDTEGGEEASPEEEQQPEAESRPRPGRAVEEATKPWR